MGLVIECEIFQWADFNRDPVVPPGGDSSSPSSSAPALTAPSAPGNDAEGRRRLLAPMADSANTCVRGVRCGGFQVLGHLGCGAVCVSMSRVPGERFLDFHQGLGLDA